MLPDYTEIYECEKCHTLVSYYKFQNFYNYYEHWESKLTCEEIIIKRLLE
jgi:hypothetical protein